MHIQQLELNGNNLTVSLLTLVARDPQIKVTISDLALGKVNESRNWVERAIEEKKIIYGITTGFGSFKHKYIDEHHTKELQLNLMRSHACGTGPAFSADIVRAIMILRVNSLIKGNSGVRVVLIEQLLSLINNNIIPYIPSKGSVGSSGDLAPLCHMGLVLIGEGECLVEGNRVPSAQVLKQYCIEPIQLEAKEGLAISNGTTVQTAVGALALYDGGIAIDSADLIAALSTEVLMGSRTQFRAEISAVRNQIGQQRVAHNIWKILMHSPMINSHVGCDRVQDSYALRCIPQVHGAVRDCYDYAYQIISRELNAATDNPLIFPDIDESLSGGNFHGEPIAIAMDAFGIAIAELANISERRIARMGDPATSEGLPAFLIQSSLGGLHSGLMIPQYTAAALVSENKVLAHPASVDSIPTSANQEDHVSMGTIAARKAKEIVENVQTVLAIELLCNTQAYEFRKPIGLAPLTHTLYHAVRVCIPQVDADRTFFLDIEKLKSYIVQGLVSSIVRDGIDSWNSAIPE
jgi:histidine ammonia-lyase